MGRRRHSKHGQKRQQNRGKRRGVRPEHRQPLQRVHGSDPECGGREGTGTDSPLWNSLDEQSLAGLSPPPSLSALVAADYVYKSGLSSDEMEVTRKLSCLNFSVLPCDPDTLSLPPTAIQHLHHHGDHASGRVPCPLGTLRGSVHATDNMSDVESYAELQLAAQLNEVLLPTVDHHKKGEDGGGRRLELEAMDCEQRRRRKRPSRKRPNRRTKKMRMHHYSEGSTCGMLKQSVQPLSKNFIGGSLVDAAKDKDLAEREERLRRNRSFKRLRRQIRPESRDPMLCILSDTSAICEADQERGSNSRDGEIDDLFDITPPADGILPIGIMMEGLGSIGGPSVSLEELPNDSDLSETTSDRYVHMLAKINRHLYASL